MSFSLPRLVWIRAQSQACRERRVFGTAPVARPHPSRPLRVRIGGASFGHAQSFSAVVSLLFTPIIQTMSTWPNFRGCHLPTELHGLSDRE
jgi:hypothetical protein